MRDNTLFQVDLASLRGPVPLEARGDRQHQEAQKEERCFEETQVRTTAVCKPCSPRKVLQLPKAPAKDLDTISIWDPAQPFGQTMDHSVDRRRLCLIP